MSSRVLVTGGNGHLGFHVVRDLLDHGYQVRATVRDLEDPVRVAHLQALRVQGADLELVRSELLDPPSLQKAMMGIDTLFHTAAPNLVWDKDPVRKIIRPIVEGTENVLKAASTQGVKSVVFTSSCSAVGMRASPENPLTEDQWYTEAQTELIQAKIDAEKLAWKMAGACGFRLATICVPQVTGPGFHRHTPVTLGYYKAWIGKATPLPRLGFHLLDVRDAAAAHRLAHERATKGGRFIVAGEYLESRDLIRLIKRVAPSVRFSEAEVPAFLLRGFAGLDWLIHKVSGRPRELTRGMVREYSGMFQRVSTKKAEAQLGFRFRPAEETLKELFDWIAAHPSIPL